MTSPIILVSRAEAKALGLKRYYTGKTCKNGHLAERLVSDRSCLECRAIRAATPQHREYMTAYQSKWYVEHKEEIIAYRAANADRFSTEARREYSQQYYTENKERYRENDRRYREENPGASNARMRNRRARRRAAPGSHTADDIAEILRLQRNRCAYCRTKLGPYEVDHIVPLALGGSNDRRNLQLLCQHCNRRKHAKDPIVFAREHGKLL